MSKFHFTFNFLKYHLPLTRLQSYLPPKGSPTQLLRWRILRHWRIHFFPYVWYFPLLTVLSDKFARGILGREGRGSALRWRQGYFRTNFGIIRPTSRHSTDLRNWPRKINFAPRKTNLTKAEIGPRLRMTTI